MINGNICICKFTQNNLPFFASIFWFSSSFSCLSTRIVVWVPARRLVFICCPSSSPSQAMVDEHQNGPPAGKKGEGLVSPLLSSFHSAPASQHYPKMSNNQGNNCPANKRFESQRFPSPSPSHSGLKWPSHTFGSLQICPTKAKCIEQTQKVQREFLSP